MLTSLLLFVVTLPAQADEEVRLDSSTEIVTVSVSEDLDEADWSADVGHEEALAAYERDCEALGGLVVAQDAECATQDLTAEEGKYEVVIRQTVSCINAFAVVDACLERARVSENEAAAAGALKTTTAAQTDYVDISSPHSFAPLPETLEDRAPRLMYVPAPEHEVAPLGEWFQPEPRVIGPEYDWRGEVPDIVAERQGVRSFYIDETGVICENGTTSTIVLPIP
jgi:hypothetical protein